MVEAGENLRIAQHRDTRRYQQVRSGGYLARLRKFEVGDYVYIRQVAENTLTPSVKGVILRIREDLGNGVYLLEDKDGKTMKENSVNMAPCHLPNPDGLPAREGLRKLRSRFICEQCKGDDHLDKMLICEACARAWHLWCNTPALSAVPAGAFLCPACLRLGMLPTDPALVEDTRRESSRKEKIYVPPPTAAAKRREEQMLKLDGAQLWKLFLDPTTGKERGYKGVATFKPQEQPPYRFEVLWEDGEKELESASYVQRYLARKAAVPRGLITIPQARTLIFESKLDDLPRQWSWDIPMRCHSDMQKLQPGFTMAAAHRLVRRMPGGAAFLQKTNEYGREGKTEVVPTTEGELMALKEVINWSKLMKVFDTFAGTNTIKRFLKTQCGLKCWTNDIDQDAQVDFHRDALQPEFYMDLKACSGCDTIMTSPWFAVSDLAVTLSVEAAPIVLMLLSSSFVFNPTESRLKWLNQLQWWDRVAVVAGLPHGPKGHSNVWLCVFESSHLRKEVMKLDRTLIFVERPHAPIGAWLELSSAGKDKMRDQDEGHRGNEVSGR